MSKTSWKYVPYVFLFLLVFIVWGKVLNQAFLGEGAAYIVEPAGSMIDRGARIAHRYDVGALLFFNAVKDIIRDQMSVYMLVLLIGEALVACALFLVIKKVTRSNWAALFASILFITNYIGSFQILGVGYYQWFIQRVPWFSISLIGLYFLERFLDEDKIWLYITSLFCYLLSLFLAHYSLLILPIFIIRPFTKLISKKIKVKKYLRTILLTSLFVLGSYLMIKDQGLKKEREGIVTFLMNNGSILKKISPQITKISVPPGVVMFIAKAFGELDLNRFFVFSTLQIIDMITFPLMLLMSVITFVIYKKEKEIGKFLLALLLSLPLSLLMIIYLSPYFTNIYEPSRYLYLASILSSSFWGIFLYWLAKKNKVLKVIVGSLLLAWVVHNNSLIQRKFDSLQKKHDTVLLTIDLLRQYEFESGISYF